MYDSMIRQITTYLPPSVAQAVRALPADKLARLEELRFRMDCEVSAVFAGREGPLSLTAPLVCTAAMLQGILNAATGYSAYAAGDAMRQGFLPLQGGHRLGLCGTAVLDGGQLTAIKEPSSLNLRIAKAWTGCADGVLQAMEGRMESTLLLGPPGSGKTTLLRDLVRQLSDRYGQRMGVVDSRGELAACVGGRPQLPIGRRTDVISLAPKEAGMELLLRVMNPAWIAVDEITAAADLEAMARAGYCGVRLLATAHGFGPEELRRRPLYRQLAELGIFRNLLVLDGNKQARMERMEDVC
ncbi:MAG: stage III sporulation protein AB [Oscillospiraceae bacterium]|nr:stage III sporulation protein AB [Oscillospiraceae bacterium]